MGVIFILCAITSLLGDVADKDNCSASKFGECFQY